jgi:hypothetical protein
LKSSFCPDQRRPTSGIEDIVMFIYVNQPRPVQLATGIRLIPCIVRVRVPGITRDIGSEAPRRKRRGIKELGVSVLNRRRKPVIPSSRPATSLVAVQKSVDTLPSTISRSQGVKRKRCSDGSDSSLAAVDSLVKRVKSYVDTDFEAIQKKYNPDGTLTQAQLDSMIAQQQEKVRFLEQKQYLAELSVVSVTFKKEQQSEYSKEVGDNSYLGPSDSFPMGSSWDIPAEIPVSDNLGSQFLGYQMNEYFFPADGLNVSNWMNYTGQAWPCTLDVLNSTTQNMVIFENQNGKSFLYSPATSCPSQSH